jgi:hypothetical protein
MKKTIYVMALGVAVSWTACNKQDNASAQNAENKTKSTAMRSGASHTWDGDDKDECPETPGNCSAPVIITNKKPCDGLNVAIAGGPGLVQEYFNNPQLDPTFRSYWDPADLQGLRSGTLFMNMVHNPATNLYFYFVGNTPQVSQQNFEFVYQFVY